MGLHRINFLEGAGIFSDLTAILSGIWYCSNNSIPFNVHWFNQNYGNIDANGKMDNLFDEYFFQKKYPNMEVDFVYDRFTPYRSDITGLYFFNNRKDEIFEDIVYQNLYKPSQLIRDVDMLNSSFFNSLNSNFFGNQKVLGVHRRGTTYKSHPIYNVEDETYFDLINEEFKKNSYDKIFIITDDGQSLESFKKEYGNQLIHTDTQLTTDGISPEFQKHWDRKLVMEQCMRDVFYLAQTDFKILVHSNVSLWSLLFNLQKNSFKVIQSHF